MATIASLPDELISIILGYKDIIIEDIINFRCTCKQFRYAGNYPKYMEKKFSQRWPSLKKYCDILSKTKDQEEFESKKKKFKKNINFVELGINYTRKLRKYVSDMRFLHCHNESIDNCINFKYIFKFNHLDIRNYKVQNYCDQSFSIFSFFNDELKNLLTHSPRTNCDLTERYNYTKLLHSIKEFDIQKKWYKVMVNDDVDLSLEWSAIIVAQTIQIQKDVSSEYIAESLDNIATEVQNFLKEKHPDHSIFSTPATFFDWKNNKKDKSKNLWDEAEGIQIFDALEEYMFGKLNFRPCKVNDTNLEYMCIDNVLKSKYGQEIILIIIYHSVANRLGLNCNIVGLEDQSEPLCIYWKSKYGTNNPRKKKCFSITFGKFPDCLVNKLHEFRSRHLPFYYAVTYKYFAPPTLYQMRNELMLRVMNLIYHNNNTSQIIHDNRIGLLRKNKFKFEIKRLRLKKAGQFVRTEDVKFGVGMIVTHRDECSNCNGVIIGWDRHTDRRYEIFTQTSIDSRELLRHKLVIDFLPFNHCHNYKFREKQTNYIILTDNNKICYVNEDNLTLAAPKWIDNYEIGRYFCKFENTHYVPNEMLTKLYPEDAAIITQRTKISKPHENII